MASASTTTTSVASGGGGGGLQQDQLGYVDTAAAPSANSKRYEKIMLKEEGPRETAPDSE